MTAKKASKKAKAAGTVNGTKPPPSRMPRITLDPELAEHLPALEKLSRDMKLAAARLGSREARYIVDMYYQMQEQRKRGDNQRRAMEKAGEPRILVEWLTYQQDAIEQAIRNLMRGYAANHIAGSWSLGVHGVGPIISAAMLAHVDVTRTVTASKLWYFAGHAPPETQKWEKGKKIPWNASLKLVGFHIGECAKKFSGSDKSYYGPFYKAYKQREIERNEAGLNAEAAKRQLETKNFARDTVTRRRLEQGKFSDAHLDRRACRKAAKLFMAHWHEVRFTEIYGIRPPLGYINSRPSGEHIDYYPPPDWPEVLPTERADALEHEMVDEDDERNNGEGRIVYAVKKDGTRYHPLLGTSIQA